MGLEDEGGAGAIAEDLFRRESVRLIAALTRLLGPRNLALAEDVVQDALLSALQAWRFGVPEDPAGWILKTAKNRAIDKIRRGRRLAELAPELESEWTLAATVEGAFAPSEDAANQLAMMFSCCHEDLSEETQVTLILRFLCGLGPKEIARAFLADTATIDRRIHRGRERLEALGRLHDVRDPREIGARMPAVMRALYLLFNEGYHGSDATNPLRASLCAEAIRLVDMLLASEIAAGPDVHALQALFCFNAARLSTRLDAEGVFVPLAEQDRTGWDRGLLERGVVHLGISASGADLTRWHIEAGIACEHSLAASVEATNWTRIVELYDALLAASPGPVVVLNRALAVAELHGVDAGCAALDAVRGDARLARYPFYWAALADLDRRAGRIALARESYAKAIVLARSTAERRAYERKVDALDEQAARPSEAVDR